MVPPGLLAQWARGDAGPFHYWRPASRLDAATEFGVVCRLIPISTSLEISCLARTWSRPIFDHDRGPYSRWRHSRGGYGLGGVVPTGEDHGQTAHLVARDHEVRRRGERWPDDVWLSRSPRRSTGRRSR